MRQAYAHEAVLDMSDGEDDRAPGGAITVALCGALEHDPPCPVAAHHTAVAHDGDQVRLRVLFAAPPHRVDEVRGRIDEALGAGSFAGPDGQVSRWRLVRSGCIPVPAGDRPHGRRLLK